MRELNEDQKKRANNVIAKIVGFHTDEITPDTKFYKDLQFDYFDFVECIIDLEDEFGISIPDEDAEKVQTVGEFHNIIATII